MTHLESRRQVAHLIFGLTIVILLVLGWLNEFVLFNLLILNLIISLILKHYQVPVLTWLMELMDRTEDIKIFPAKGTFMFLLGVFLVVWLFPIDIAVAAVLILTFGDGVSTFVGTHFGKNKIHALGKKTWEGSIAGFGAAVLSSLFFLPLLQALIASTVAMLAEAFEIKFGKWVINDNITVPLVAASTVWFMRFVI